MHESGLMSNLSSTEKMKILVKNIAKNTAVDRIIRNEPLIKSIIEKYNPDIYAIDDIIGSPSLMYSGKPWVRLVSTAPLFFFDDERTPPPCSGKISF